MLPKHYRNRYALIIVLSLLIHAVIVGVLLWGIPDQEEKPKKKSVVVKLKHIDQTEKKTEPKKAESKKAESKKADKESKKAESKKADKKAESKKADKKAESKKADKKAEPKKADKKAEPKKADKKAEPKKADNKAEPKKADKKAEPKKAEPKKAEPKKAEPKKAEPKKAEPKKAEPKKAEPKKAEPKKAEPKKAEPKKAEPKKAEPKKAEPKKVEPKKAEPKELKPKQIAKTSKVDHSKVGKNKELDQKKNINKKKNQTSKKDLKPTPKRQKKVGSMQMLDDTQMKNMFIATSGASQKFQDRNVRGLSAIRNLNVIERQEFDLFFSKGADRILKKYIAPKKDGREYSGKIAILINKDGYITNVRFKKRSGHDGLDLAMFNAVNKTPRLALPRDPEAAYAMYTMPMVLWYNQDDMAD